MSELESEFLNLQKKFQNFKYEDLYDNNQVEKSIKDEDITTNNYLYVQEQEVLLKDIQNLCIYFRNTEIEGQKHFEFPFSIIKKRITYVIDKYQEQPNLLDSLMNKMVVPIMEVVKLFLHKFMKEQFKIHSNFHLLLQIISVLCKTRGQKTIVEYFPHEVKDLEPCIFYLQNQLNEDQVFWETKYVILLWLSIIILVPFDLDSIDSSNNKQTIFEQLMNISKNYINSSSLTREAAAKFLAKYFSRPDIQKTNYLKEYIEWALSLNETQKSDPLFNFFISGVYKSLGEILKAGQRQELLPNIPLFMKFVNMSKSDQSVDRLYKVKLAFRIGMIYLKPRITLWAYKKQVKKLNLNFSGTSKLQVNNKITEIKKQKQKQDQSEQDDPTYFKDIDIENLEDIIEFLLQCLSDKDTVVRWAAAKGIGRITARLDYNMADDIVNALFQILNFDRDECNWHGCCLTLAELSRRGLLLPNRLDQAFNYLHKALLFDENKGNVNTGANVRDSACYVAWAFARAFDPSVLKDYQVDLAKSLLKVTLYDREVNCRRAASAAFQEHVGRQGTFPHGIEIVTEADYFTVGMALNSFINVGLYVSNFDVYFDCFVDHLVENKLGHSDQNMRTRSAAALAVMVPLNPQYFIIKSIPQLIQLAQSDLVNERHGSLFALGDILLGLNGLSEQHNWQNKTKDSIFLFLLSKNEQTLIQAGEYRQIFNDSYNLLKNKNNLDLINQDLQDQIMNIIVKIKDKKQLRGKSGEFMRLGICRLIQCFSTVRLQIGKYESICIELINECLQHINENIQISAKDALSAYSQAQLQNEISENHINWIKKMIKEMDLSKFQDVPVRGYTRAVGVLNSKLKLMFLDDLIKVFQQNTDLTQKRQDAETRKFTVQAIQQIINDVSLAEINPTRFDQLMTILFNCMEDYTLDNRGDIGSIVREQTLMSLNKMICLINNQDKSILTEELIQKIIKIFLQQLVEKIDRSRLVAGSCIQDFFNNTLVNLDFQHKDRLSEIFLQKNINLLNEQKHKELDKQFSIPTVQAQLAEVSLEQKVNKDQIFAWNLPNYVYPLVTPLLSIPNYTEPLLRGIFVSAGGLSNQTSTEASQSLIKFINQEKDIQHLFSVIKGIFPPNNRLQLPLLAVLDNLYQSLSPKQGSQLQLALLDLSQFLLSYIQEIIKSSNNIHIILNAVGVGAGISEFNKEWAWLGHALAHKYSKVRQRIADRLSVGLMNLEIEEADEISDWLMEQDWSRDDMSKEERLEAKKKWVSWCQSVNL